MGRLLLERIKAVFLKNMNSPREVWRVRYTTLDGKEEVWTTDRYYAAVDFSKVFTKGRAIPERVWN